MIKKISNVLLFFLGFVNHVSGGCTYYEPHGGSVSCDNTEGRNDDFPDKIFSNITYLQLDSTKSDQQWILTKLDSFTRFYNLSELKLLGHFSISQNLAKIKTLTTELLNIKTLKSFLMSDCAFAYPNREYAVRWKLPPSLESVTLLMCRPEAFDWTDVRKLTYLDVRTIDFINLSKIAHPSAASLTEFHTSNLTHILRIPDIAYLCHLNVFSFDYNLLNGTAIDQHCECQRYKNWQNYLLNVEKVNLRYEIWMHNSPECSSTNWNCSNYTLEEAKQNRTKCLNLANLAPTSLSTSWILLTTVAAGFSCSSLASRP